MIVGSLGYTDVKVSGSNKGIILGYTDGKVIGNVDGITLGIDVETDLVSLDRSFGNIHWLILWENPH